MRQCADGRLLDSGGDRTRAVLGDNHPMTAGRFGAAQDSAEIVRIRDTVEKQKESTAAAVSPADEEIVKGEIGKWRHPQQRPLMVTVSGEPIEILPFARPGRYIRLPSKIGQFFKTAGAPAAGEKKLKRPAEFTPQRLAYRVDAVNELAHPFCARAVPISSIILSAATCGSAAAAIGRPITR